MNTKAFYKLSSKRNEIEESINKYDLLISECREEARKLKKGSQERQELMSKANDILNSLEYQKLKSELDMITYCINIMFYN